MSELPAGPALDAAIGKLLGLDVLGVSGCSREPECGEWEPTGQWAESGREGAPRAVYLQHCCCEFAEADDARLFGHISYCLAVVPAYSVDIAAAWTVIGWVRSLGIAELYVCYDKAGYWEVELLPADAAGPPGAFAQADSAPLAICRAALCALAGVDSDGFPAPAASSCHCAALLPALRRWLAATDAAEAHGALAVFAEYTGAAQALEALAREVTRD